MSRPVALVTGASSGIGLAITAKLASQGLNVVMVAMPDELLDKSHAKMAAEFPALQFVKVPCNLGKPGYVEVISKATEALDVV